MQQLEEKEHKKLHLLYISLGLEKFLHPQVCLKEKLSKINIHDYFTLPLYDNLIESIKSTHRIMFAAKITRITEVNVDMKVPMGMGIDNYG